MRRGFSGILRADGVTDVRKLLLWLATVAVLRSGFGGP